MVWALQGAGKLFKSSAEFLRERDENKAKGSLLGLHYELNLNNDAILEGKRHRVSVSCMQFAMGNPPIQTDAFVRILSDVFFALQEYKSAESALTKEERTDLNRRMDTLHQQVMAELNKRGVKVFIEKNGQGE
jgi:hypothetical protein